MSKKSTAEVPQQLGLRCIRTPDKRMAVVFVHGILSCGETAWTSDSGNDWPTMLCEESSLDGVGCYVYSYDSSLSAAGYSIEDAADDLKEELGLAGVLGKKDGPHCRIVIFICHSMGGVVVRRYLVTQSHRIAPSQVRVGLFLVASPSRGSSYADFIAWLAKQLGHSQADALKTIENNKWLATLNKDFINLRLDSKRADICGKELIESRMISFSRSPESPRMKSVFLRIVNSILWWFSNRGRTPIVTEEEGAAYFVDPYKVPQSDHFTIAKPSSRRAIQHRLLLEFISTTSEGLVDIAVTSSAALPPEPDTSPPQSESTSGGSQADSRFLRNSIPFWLLILFCGIFVRYATKQPLATGVQAPPLSNPINSSSLPRTATGSLTFTSTHLPGISGALGPDNYRHEVILSIPESFAVDGEVHLKIASPIDSELAVTYAGSRLPNEKRNICQGRVSIEESQGSRKVRVEVAMRNDESVYPLPTMRYLQGSDLTIFLNDSLVAFELCPTLTFTCNPSNDESDFMEKPNFSHTVVIKIPLGCNIAESPTVTVTSPSDSKIVVTSAGVVFESDRSCPNFATGRVTPMSDRALTGVRTVRLDVAMRNLGDRYKHQMARALGGRDLSIQIDGMPVQMTVR